MKDTLVSVILSTIGGIFIGWVFAHNTVAAECNKLKSFYVGDKIYQCEMKQ
jgi:hypothetical protein